MGKGHIVALLTIAKLGKLIKQVASATLAVEGRGGTKVVRN